MIDLENRGINTSLENAQVITKDKTIDPIDIQLHTDMLNKGTRTQFVIDVLKTGTLVPTVAKGVYQGVNGQGQNVLGQLANSMGTNGANIVAFANGTKDKLDKLIAENKDADGKVNITSELQSEVVELLTPLLAEYGKDGYEINFVHGLDQSVGMSVNDLTGKISINLDAAYGFGSAENMLSEINHEGNHGTYANTIVDEIAADRGTTDKVAWDKSVGYKIADNMKDIVALNTAGYLADRDRGEVRDNPVLGFALIAAGIQAYRSYKATQHVKNNKDLTMPELIELSKVDALKGTLVAAEIASGIGAGSIIGTAWGVYDGVVIITDKNPVGDAIVDISKDASKLVLGEENEILIEILAISGNIVLRAETIKLENNIKNAIVSKNNVWDIREGGGKIQGVEYSQHALERMAPNTAEVRAELSTRAANKAIQLGYIPGSEEYYNFVKKYVDPRGIPPIVIKNAIQTTTPTLGSKPGTFIHETDNIKVIVNNHDEVITVVPKGVQK